MLNREEQITKFKEVIFQETNEEAIENSTVSPIIRILCEAPGQDKPLIALVPIPNELFRNEQTKDILSEKIIPQILSELVGQGNQPFALSMVTEGWARQLPAEMGASITADEFNRIKDTLPREEVVNVSIETLTGSSHTTLYKQGTKKNEDGEWCEGVWLKRGEEVSGVSYSGRFTNLLKKLPKQETIWQKEPGKNG